MTNLSKSESKDMTANGWPMVPLGSVLTRVKEEVDLQDDVIYKQTTVRLWNKGVVLRGEQSGREIKTKRQFRIHSGQLVLSRIDVRNGAIGLVPPELDDAIISNDFWTYEVDQGQLAPKFLALCVTTPSFQDEANRASSGTTHRIRAEEEGFLQINVPLPPLEEQRRIVARIEELATKIEEARGLRQKAVEEASSFVSSLHLKLGGTRVAKLGDILRLDELQEEVQLGKQYPQVGVKGFGQGLFSRETLDASQTTYRKFNRLYDGAVVLSQVKGWEGAIAVCRANLAGRYVSPEYRTFRCIPGMAIPEYLAALFAVPWFWGQLKNLTRGVGGRRERIRPEFFLEIELPMPMVEQQQQTISMFEKVDAVKRLQAETSAELEVLLPSVLDRAFKREL